MNIKKTYTQIHLEESIEIIKKLNLKNIEQVVDKIRQTKKRKGRIFFLGVGGSAANCSHAVNDFRKMINVIVIIINGNNCNSCSKLAHC